MAETVAMLLLVTSASGANGNGFGALLSFELDGTLRGTFIDDDRIVDPRGLAVDPNEHLLFLNSGADRVVAISSRGRIVRDSGRIEGLNPGGGNFGPDGRYFVSLRSQRTVGVLSISLDAAPELVLPPRVVPCLGDSLSVRMAGCFSRQESAPMAEAITPYQLSLQPHL
jgi:hypothetical protein